MRKIILPIPPTDNSLRIPARGRLVKSKVYREWNENAEIYWLQWIRSHPDFVPYAPTKQRQMEFQYCLYLPSWRSDINNYVKALNDFLGGNKTTPRLFEDDHFVSLRLILPVEVDRENPRVEICPYPDNYAERNW